jgi:RNA-directed DNA polymerase
VRRERRSTTKDGPKFRGVFKPKHVSEGVSKDGSVDALRNYASIGTSRTDLLDRLRVRRCEACEQTDVMLGIHHARRLSDISHQSLRARVAASRRRKRLVLCQPCHRALHNGTLTRRLHQLKAEVGAG